MKTSVDAKALVKKLKNAPPKGRYTLYLSESVFEAFKSACKSHDLSASAVTEAMMESFVANNKSGK